MSTVEQESLIDLRNDLISKASLVEKELSCFWISQRNQYLELSEKAVKSLLPFGSSYLCEFGFSVLTEIKSKKRQWLQMMDTEMRVCLSNIKPRLSKIYSHKHAQISYWIIFFAMFDNKHFTDYYLYFVNEKHIKVKRNISWGEARGKGMPRDFISISVCRETK